jgi:hypothetical protein
LPQRLDAEAFQWRRIESDRTSRSKGEVEVRFRGALILLGTVAALTLLLAPPALAATEVGTECESNQLNGLPRTLVSLAHSSSSPYPVTIPQSGVITGWRSRESAGTETVTRVKVVQPVVRVAGEEPRYRVLAQSEPQTLHAGVNRFPARIPVQAGDLIGLSGSAPEQGSSVPMCEEAAGQVVALEGDPAVGAEAETQQPFGGHQVPLVAIVEPDVDGDGFGDETQDLCPQSAATQAACPRPSLLLRGRAGSRSATLFVSCSAPATVQVIGSVRLGEQRRLQLHAEAQNLTAGDDASFILRFPPKLRLALRRLRPKHSLRLRITATATNGAGEPIEGVLGLRLTGRAARKGIGPTAPRTFVAGQ